MSRRRLERQQERDNFLQQFEELITFNTRIEVVEVEGPPIPLPPAPPPGPPQVRVEEVGAEFYGPQFPNFDVVISQDGGPQESLLLGPSILGPNVLLTESVQGDDFVLLAASEDPTLPFHQGVIDNVDGQPFGPTVLSISENGFGVVSAAEFFGEGEGGGPPVQNSEDMQPIPEIPSGLDTISQGEHFGFDSGLIWQEHGGLFGEDDEGAISFGIDFTASGRGSVEITLFHDFDEAGHTETFDIPFGQTADDVLNFEVDLPEGEVFDFAQVTVTGSAEISIIGVDITSNINQFGPPEVS